MRKVIYASLAALVFTAGVSEAWARHSHWVCVTRHHGHKFCFLR